MTDPEDKKEDIDDDFDDDIDYDDIEYPSNGGRHVWIDLGDGNYFEE